MLKNPTVSESLLTDVKRDVTSVNWLILGMLKTHQHGMARQDLCHTHLAMYGEIILMLMPLGCWVALEAAGLLTP